VITLEKCDALNGIWHIIDEYDKEHGKDSSLEILSKILHDLDLDTASNLVKANCEPYLTKSSFEDLHFDEGNEEAGYIKLQDILDTVEEIINCDDYSSDIKFKSFIRPETDEEKIDEGHDENTEWFTFDEDNDFNKYIQFEEI
jgi:hypothetical protein